MGLPLLALTWTGTPSGGLYRLARESSAPWGLIAALLFGAGLWRLPVVLMDLPHPRAHTVSTVLDKTVIAQQKPLQLLAMLSLLSAGASAWFLRHGSCATVPAPRARAHHRRTRPRLGPHRDVSGREQGVKTASRPGQAGRGGQGSADYFFLLR